MTKEKLPCTTCSFKDLDAATIYECVIVNMSLKTSLWCECDIKCRLGPASNSPIPLLASFFHFPFFLYCYFCFVFG
ncbi:hypothetical protein SLEP1_g6725 [Rubroshorea leprosula]|uniref:Uncharacterized protein n=1 Tax=Rubroshorea leprosula TaxID=152421 RepID=A0AAV5HW54_9ROSI|nr:hypothetical protein SLEP1_g6725 [Rubroshorea leprosula]